MKPAMTVVLVAFCLFGDEPVFAQDTSATQSETVGEHRWVGFSATITNGAIKTDFGLLQGQSAMHKICAAEVAASARACFTSEVARSVVEGRPDTTGWVIPTGYALYADPSATEGDLWFAQDTATGLTGSSVGNPSEAAESLSCGSFLNSQTSGIVVNPLGMVQTSCSSQHRVACCAPTAIRVTPSP